MVERLLGVFHCAAFADHVHLDLAGIIQLFLDLLGDGTGQQNQLVVADGIRFYHDAHLAAGLHGKGVFHALEAAADLFQILQPLDVAFQVLAAGTGPCGADGVGGHHDEGQRSLGLHIAMVRLNGVNNGGVLLVLAGNLHTDLDVAAFDLVIQSLADVMQQTRAAGLGHVHAHLAGQQTGEIGNLQRVVQYVLAEAGAELQAAQQLHDIGMDAVDAHLHHRTLALPLHGQLQLAAALLHSLLNAGGVDAAVGNQALQRHAGHLTAGLVEAGQGDGFGGVVDDQVHAGGGFQGADVAALAADDAALHLVVGQGNHAHGGLAGMVGGTPGDGLADHLAGHGVALVLQVGLVGADAHGLFVGQLLIQAVQQQVLGVLLGQAGNGFQLFHLAQFQLFQFVQLRLHQLAAAALLLFLLFQSGHLLVQGFLLLVQAALLAAQLAAALLDFLVGLGFHAQGFVLGLDYGFLAFLFCGFDGVVHNPHCFFFGAADLCFSGFAAVALAQKKACGHTDGDCNDCHHYQCDNGRQCFQLLK